MASGKTSKTKSETLARAIVFFHTMTKQPVIRARMAEYGYTDAEHDEGWNCISRACSVGAGQPGSNQQEVRSALVEIDGWDDATFRRCEPALARKHPAQRELVFVNLAPASGLESVVCTETFLDRLDVLQSSPEREGTRAEDHAALQTLAERGVTPAERARMRKLIEVVKKGASLHATDKDDAQLAEEQLEKWLLDWSETARVALRRDHLVLLGLSKRKRRKSPEAEPVTPPTAPNPAPAPAPVAPPSPFVPAANGPAFQ
jgi:hypothetical protein